MQHDIGGAGDVGPITESLVASACAVSSEIILPEARVGRTGPLVEAVSSLELERSVFDSAETDLLSAAFDKAWAYVEFDPSLGTLNTRERQAELARCLMALLKLGNYNPISIANSAIALLRKNQSRIFPRQIVRDRVSERQVGAAR
jgi:hypothetical protein